MDSPRVTAAVQRLKKAFQDGPATRLTLQDAARLSGLEEPLCQAVLRALEDARVVSCEKDGRYVRRLPGNRE
jgi:hypothetical protein